jgi:hypothetical protein
MKNAISGVALSDLTLMKGEALVLRGCGGNLNEWVDGINELLTNERILLDGTKFTEVFTFDYDGLTCLGFAFTKDVKLDVGKLAIWRLQTRDNFGGIWLSDFVANYLTTTDEEEEEE